MNISDLLSAANAAMATASEQTQMRNEAISALEQHIATAVSAHLGEGYVVSATYSTYTKNMHIGMTSTHTPHGFASVIILETKIVNEAYILSEIDKAMKNEYRKRLAEYLAEIDKRIATDTANRAKMDQALCLLKKD